MVIQEELRTFTDEANRLSLAMIGIVDNIGLGLIDSKEGAKILDRYSRDMRALQDCIHDLSYRLSLGQDRVSTVQVLQ